MSSKNLGRAVQPKDRYLTPRGAVKAAVEKLRRDFPNFQPMSVLEPGSAWGVHLDYVCDNFDTIVRSTALDLQEEPVDPQHEFVVANYLLWEPDQLYDLIITNPPFSLAELFIRRAVRHLAPGGICMFLIREAVVGGKDRTAYLWTEINLRWIWQLDRRPSFVYGGNDSCEYAYVLFDGGLPGKPMFDWLPWRDL